MDELRYFFQVVLPKWLGFLTMLALAAPLLGSILIIVSNKWHQALPRIIALLAAIFSLAGGCGVLAAYRGLLVSRQAIVRAPVGPIILGEGSLLTLDEGERAIRITYLWGIDGISAVLVWLTSLLTFSSVLVSLKTIRERTVEYYSLLLLMAGSSMLVFVAFDVLFFYLLFEFTLVPMFFLIGIWGGPERRYAARKFFIYTLAGSLIGLVAILAYAIQLHELGREAGIIKAGTAVDKRASETSGQMTSIPEMGRVAARLNQLDGEHSPVRQRWEDLQKWAFWGLLVAFAIKVPLVPLHTWLPLAHVEAPTAGSVFLAGILLKLGTYGFLRVALPLLPNAMAGFGLDILAVLAVVGIIYGSLCAAAQSDIKRLVAYSSIAHMGFCMLGMASVNSVGLAGSVLEMINHGLYTGGLFLLVGMLYERYHTRTMQAFSGLAKQLPMWSFFMIGMSLASIALPGLNGFVSETLCLAGMFRKSAVLSALGASGMVLGAWYMLTMLRQVVFGPVQEPGRHLVAHRIEDLDLCEWLAIAIPFALCLALGVYPKAMLDLIRPDLEGLAAIFQGVP